MSLMCNKQVHVIFKKLSQWYLNSSQIYTRDELPVEDG